MIVARGLGKGSNFGGLATFGLGVGGLLERILKSISLPWQIRGGVASQTELLWILSGGRVAQSIELRWELLKLFSRPVVTVWASQAETQDFVSQANNGDVWTTKK